PQAVAARVGRARPVDGSYRGPRSIVDDFYTRTGDPQTMQGAMTGHLTTNQQIDLDGDEATTTAYFFEIVDDSLVLIGTYQHRMRRDADRWRFAQLRITVRYRARLEVEQVGGRTLSDVLARPL